MDKEKEFLIEGFTEKEINELIQSEEFLNIIFSDEPVIFKAGSSEILGNFKKQENELTITFSHIIGGGEGVLLKLMNMFRDYAKNTKKVKITWVVHAVDCPKPNPKLPKILEKKKFFIVNDPIDGNAYQKVELI